MNEEINERLINEYISKVGCCDECFASVYCTINGLRESRVPQDYCVKNIKAILTIMHTWGKVQDQGKAVRNNVL